VVDCDDNLLAVISLGEQEIIFVWRTVNKANRSFILWQW
jgi:hypothetical protein